MQDFINIYSHNHIAMGGKSRANVLVEYLYYDGTHEKLSVTIKYGCV